MRNTANWMPVARSDEYADSHSEQVHETRDFMYYYNPERGVVRRYTVNDGAYCELRVYKRPVAYGADTLGSTLSTAFRQAAKRGTLRNVEPGTAFQYAT